MQLLTVEVINASSATVEYRHLWHFGVCLPANIDETVSNKIFRILDCRLTVQTKLCNCI